MLRDPDRMSTEERDAEVAHLLGKALLRIHTEQKHKTTATLPTDAARRLEEGCGTASQSPEAGR